MFFGFECFGLCECEFVGVIYDFRFGFVFIDGVGVEFGEFVVGFVLVVFIGIVMVVIVVLI